MNERSMRNVDLRLFHLKWKKGLIEILKRNELKEIELIISLSKRYLVNYHQTELTIGYHDQYLNLEILLSNENDFKDSSDWFSFKIFIKLFEKTVKSSERNRCSRWSFDKVIINSIDSKRKSFSRSKNDNRSNDQSKKSIIKLANIDYRSYVNNIFRHQRIHRFSDQ